MGFEVTCRGQGTAGDAEGKLLLETDELIFRGPARVRIPFRTMERVSAAAGVLTVAYPGGSMRFHLGPAAERWRERIQRPLRTRLEKLGLGPSSVVSVVNLRDPDFDRELDATGATVSRGRLLARSTVIIFGVEKVADLTRLAALKAKLVPAGGIWVVHRKGKDGVKDVEIFAAGARAGLTANKVARFSDTHTAERLVIPRSAR